MKNLVIILRFSLGLLLIQLISSLVVDHKSSERELIIEIESTDASQSEIKNNLHIGQVDQGLNTDHCIIDKIATAKISSESEDEVITVNNSPTETVLNLKSKLNPIVLVPGLEGTRLEATLNKTTSAHRFCLKKVKSPFTIWINLEEFFLPVVSCWIENMRLTYDNETRTSSGAEGVNVIVPDFGDTDSIETLIGNRFVPQFYYFQNIVDSMVELGYERGKSIRGAPFDFRFAPNEQDEYFDKLIKLIETTYLENEKKKVILICHSMGCLYTMNLLNLKVKKGWKNRYISTLLTISSPWTGAIKALKTMVTGDNMGIFLFNDKRFKDMERTFPSIAFLLPNPEKFTFDLPVVITPSRNYSLNDYQPLFDRMNQQTIYDMHLDTNNLLGDLKFPDVDLHCIYGTGINTATQLIYEKDKDFPENPKKIIYDLNGDGTVNLESLEYCLKWKEQKKYEFKSLKIANGDHLNLMREPEVLKYLKDTIMNISLSS